MTFFGPLSESVSQYIKTAQYSVRGDGHVTNDEARALFLYSCEVVPVYHPVFTSSVGRCRPDLNFFWLILILNYNSHIAISDSQVYHFKLPPSLPQIGKQVSKYSKRKGFSLTGIVATQFDRSFLAT